jgi:dihydrolipoamide dehydrogenase
MADNSFDIIVVGGGPGGYVAAIRAAQLGFKTACVEREHLGGICLNWGCIPTKALLRSAEVWRNMQHADAYGLAAPGASFDLAKIVARSRAVSAQLQGGVKHLLKKNKVTVIEGSAKLAGKNTIDVEGKGKFTAPHIILATGARARVLPGLEPDGKFVWTYKQALVPDTFPKRLLVIGSGAIGIEFASFFNALGAQVTVAEAMDRVLPVEDAEISAMAKKSFEKQGMTILTGANIKGTKKGANDITVTIEAGGKTQDITVDRVITAIGIVGNVENIGLEGTKIRVEKTHILTDPYCRTDEPGIYALGDVAGAPWLAHKASHEAVICVEKIKGLPDVHPLDMRKIPGCTYCHPQVASVGLSEARAKEKGYEVRVGRFPFMANGKAIALGETEGLVKTVFDAKTGELLGAHMIGAEVTEMIQGYVVAKTLETTEAELMHTVFAHPTLSEMMHEAVLDAYGKAVHI